MLDKADCSTWLVEAIKQLLVTPKKEGGVGLSQNRTKDIDIEGSDFENIVDALLSFEGGKEAKIEHACSELTTVDDVSVRKSIVRWIFTNLLIIGTK